MKWPNKREFQRAVAVFKRHEKRDAMYVVATYWVKRFWGDSHQLSNGLGVLLLTWNNAFYRYGSFDFDELAGCIEANRPTLGRLRKRQLRRITDEAGETICRLFDDFNHALRSQPQSGDNRFTPVGTVKALHLLAPKYFPLWDKAIAEAYGHNYYYDGARRYLSFCHQMVEFKNHVVGRGYVTPEDNPLKKIDEYNYVTFTKPEWLR